MSNIYLCSQSDNTGWDTTDSFVCYATNEEEARNMLPNEYSKWSDHWSTWASSPDKVQVDLLGTTDEPEESGVILASFNAG